MGGFNGPPHATGVAAERVTYKGKRESLSPRILGCGSVVFTVVVGHVNGHTAGGGRCGGAGLRREHRVPGPDHFAVFLDRGRMHTIGFDPHLRDAIGPQRGQSSPFSVAGPWRSPTAARPSAAGTRSPGRSAAPDAPAPSCGNTSAAQAITADNRSTPLTIPDAFPPDHSGRGPDDHRMPSDADRFPPTVDPNNVFTRAVRRRTDVSTRQCQPTVESHEERSPPPSLHKSPAGTTPISRQPV